MTRRQRRLYAIGALLLGLAAAAALMFQAFRENMMYFYTPTDVAAGGVPAGAVFRLGGIVEQGSMLRGDGLDVDFVLADCDNSLRVRYAGILPDLFREGQGVVTTGRLDGDGLFVASQVLAKHDENYMPPELAERLQTETGHSCEPFRSMTQAAR